MKILITLIFTLGLACSFGQTGLESSSQKAKLDSAHIPAINNEISKDLAKCASENWTVWEVYAKTEKLHLAHIGKGIFDLHFLATYEVDDTVENETGKFVKKYHPEIILQFYPNIDRIKESARFTQMNSEIISDLHISKDFGETTDFLIYENSAEYAYRQPIDKFIIELRKCLTEKASKYKAPLAMPRRKSP